MKATSYQAETVGAHIRHCIDNKAQWDQLRREYWRTKRSRNEIALLQDLIAIGLVFMATEPNAEGGKRSARVVSSAAAAVPEGDEA